MYTWVEMMLVNDPYGARVVYLDARDGAGFLGHGEICGHAIVPRGREGRWRKRGDSQEEGRFSGIGGELDKRSQRRRARLRGDGQGVQQQQQQHDQDTCAQETWKEILK
jgi:hypothetical protein